MSSPAEETFVLLTEAVAKATCVCFPFLLRRITLERKVQQTKQHANMVDMTVSLLLLLQNFLKHSAIFVYKYSANLCKQVVVIYFVNHA